MIIKALLIFVLIAAAETIHGILRIRYLNRPLGDRRARQVSVFTGSIILNVTAWLAIPWIGVSTLSDCVVIGLLWLVLMLTFDIGLGRLYFKFSWKRIGNDFDPRKGGFLGFGMVVLFFAPILVAKLRGLI
ncbi:MAG: hypothetical protein O3C43_06210 [Verrucomicrobia bacterium]|nr:hypothetical protein [Verrucomicrobiota bacterium]MDA1066079.1 hypothetical protein [Verrucomicrobiota bacterium]